MKQKIIFWVALMGLMAGSPSKAQDVTFGATAPEAVVMGEKFQLVYTVNAEGREFRAPDLSGFDVLMGPSTATSRSIQVTNGQSQAYFLCLIPLF